MFGKVIKIGKTFTRKEKVEKIELEFDDATIELLEHLSSRTGFSIDKLVEYSLANTVIKEALAQEKS